MMKFCVPWCGVSVDWQHSTEDSDALVYTRVPAIPAACMVEMKPQTMAERAMRAMTRPRDGASAERTPI